MNGQIDDRISPQMLDPGMPLERKIRCELQLHLVSIGFSTNAHGELCLTSSSKEAIRSIHETQRQQRLRDNSQFLRERGLRLIDEFADGREVCPEAIQPHVQIIQAGSRESDLFRLASLLWSVPVSRGYGRRLRFLVRDRANGKLIGLMALGDPSFNLAARDQLIGWNATERKERLVNVLDAFVLGAVPPYSELLGGKLIASLVRSREVVRWFSERYRHRVGIISNERKLANLVAVTTNSALGRSSIYNRLRLNGVDYFKSIGFTGGWGHFHVPKELFDDMRKLLALRNHPYSRGYEFGDGPNWRLRTIRATLDLLGYKADLLRHGVRREVFISWLASNGLRVLRGEVHKPDYSALLSVSEIGALARDRWMLPRAGRDGTFSQWTRRELIGRLDTPAGSNVLSDQVVEG